MKKEWMLAYPVGISKSNWYHIRSILDAGEVYQYAISHLVTHDVKVNSICRKDIRPWVLDTRQKIETFYWYLKNSINTDDLKLRMFAREKQATLRSS